jgi:Protein of unknown function (DUF2652)
MLDAFPALKLVEVEGDALFLSAPQEKQRSPSAASDWIPSALAMYRAFHAREQWMVAHNLCACDACRQIGRLRVKFVAHLGEVATQRIRDTEKLVGVDVIAVHRMLKSTVPTAEYVLMSEPLHQQLDSNCPSAQFESSRNWKGWARCPSTSLSWASCRPRSPLTRSQRFRHGSAKRSSACEPSRECSASGRTRDVGWASVATLTEP